MRRSFLLAPLLLLAPLRLHAQSPADRLTARTGPTISAEARRYFGLVPEAPAGTTIDVAAGPGGGLTLTLHRPARPDTALVLTAERADDLARYVDQYEALYWDERDEGGPAWDLGPGLTRLRRDGLAVPATLKREVPFAYTVRLSDGTALRGRVLYADETVAALWTGDGPYRWNALDGVTLVALDHVRSASARATRAVPLALTAAAHVAAAGLNTQRPPASTSGALALGAAGTALRAYGRTLTPSGRNTRPSLARVAFFRVGTPPEFDALVAARRTSLLATRLPRPRASALDLWRSHGPFLSATLTRVDDPNDNDSVATTATASGSFPRPVPPYARRGAIALQTATWRADAEATLPLPAVPAGIVVGGSRTWFGDAPTVDADETYLSETLDDRSQSSLHVGLSVGRAGGPLLGNRIAVAYGVRRSEATLSGAFYSTVALGDGPPNNDPSAYARYSEPYERSSRFVRVAYDFLLTRVSSVFAVAEFAPVEEIARPARSVTSTYPDFGYSFTATRAAHTVRFGGRTFAGGLRVHL